MDELNHEICLNQGGINKIEIALHESPDTFYPVLFHQDSAEYKRSRKRSKEGTKLSHSLKFELLKGREEIENWLLDYAEAYFLLQVTDSNEQVYLMGNLDYPAELAEELQTGRQASDTNTYDFQFDCETPL